MKLDLYMSASFTKWMPGTEITDKFWGNDGYFYISALSINSFWKQDGSLNDNFQYIRIKVL